MRKMGSKRMALQLNSPLQAVPAQFSKYHLTLAAGGKELVYTYDTKAEESGITGLLDDSRPPASASRTCRPRRAPSRRSSSTW